MTIIKNHFEVILVTSKKQRNGIISYNITSDMIIIDDIMSEIELEISRVRSTSEMSCFNFTNLIFSMINHITCYIR
jgi:argonaute-like protein implicated in RNA metabolism and viral defense